MQSLEILYQDDYLVAVNKPSGLLVHRSWIDKDETVFALQLVRDQIGKYVYPIHRLDKPTSGVLLFALDKQTAQAMSKLFLEHSIQKEYLAIVRGYTLLEDTIQYPLKIQYDKMTPKEVNKHKEPQDAVTQYKRLATIEFPFEVGRYKTTRYSLVKLLPQTGRKHQLRRHMKHILHPIVGDTKYGRHEHNTFFRDHFDIHHLMLTAYKLSFRHPISKKSMTIKTSMDVSFQRMIQHFNWKEE